MSAAPIDNRPYTMAASLLSHVVDAFTSLRASRRALPKGGATSALARRLVICCVVLLFGCVVLLPGCSVAGQGLTCHTISTASTMTAAVKPAVNARQIEVDAAALGCDHGPHGGAAGRRHPLLNTSMPNRDGVGALLLLALIWPLFTSAVAPSATTGILRGPRSRKTCRAWYGASGGQCCCG